MATTEIAPRQGLGLNTDRLPYGGPGVDRVLEASLGLLTSVSELGPEDRAKSVSDGLTKLVAHAILTHGEASARILDLQVNPDAYIARSAGKVALLTDALTAIEGSEDRVTVLSALVLAVTDPESDRGQGVVEKFLTAQLEDKARGVLAPALERQPQLFDTANAAVYLVKTEDKETGETNIVVNPVLSRQFESLCDKIGEIVRDFQAKGLAREKISATYNRVKANVLDDVTLQAR